MTRTSKSSSSSRIRKHKGKSKFSRFDVFDFSEEDDRVEKDSKSLLGKFSDRNSSAITKYQFLQCFSKGAESSIKNVSNELIDIDGEVEKGADTFCEDVGYEPKDMDFKVVKGAKSFSKKVRVGLADIEPKVAKGAVSFSEKVSDGPIDIDSIVANSDLNCHQISSGLIDVDSEDTCTVDASLECGSVKQEISESNPLLLSRSSNYEDDVTVIFPDFVLHEDKYFTKSKLIFSCSCIKLQGSAVNGMQRTFNSEWVISDIIGIESEWCRRVETAVVNLRFKAKHFSGAGNANEIVGIDVLKFSVCDPLWSDREKAIKSMNLIYNNLWNANIDDNSDAEEISCLRKSDTFFPKQHVSEFVDLLGEVIYPKGDPDAVSISKRDLELLKPRTFINDTIVDFYMKYLQNKLQAEEKNRFYFFNSFFFRKLVDLDKDLSSACEGKAAFQRVHKWTKKVNLFEKDYIFIPVNYSLHWSLIVICHPGEVANLEDHKLENLPKVPCILHMDSIKGSHRGLKNLFQSYLCEEWKQRYGYRDDNIPAKFLGLQFVPLELPQQENLFDCALFLLHYVELFLEDAPVNFSPFKITKFPHFLNQDWFPPAEASLKRARILHLICEFMNNDREKDFSCSVGKYPSPHVNDSNNYTSRQVYIGETHGFTKTFSQKFPSGKNEQENEVSLLLTCPPKCIQFRKTELVADANYHQKGERRSSSVMSPIEEDEDGEIADTPLSLGDCPQVSVTAPECPSASNSHKASETCCAVRFSTNVEEDRSVSSRQSLRKSETICDLGKDHSLPATDSFSHLTERDEPVSLSTSSEELAACVVEDSEEENEMLDGIEIQQGNSKESEFSSSIRNNSFLSRQAAEFTANLNDYKPHDLLMSNVVAAGNSSKEHTAKRPRFVLRGR